MNNWEAIRLKDCGDWFSGGTPSRGNMDYWEGGDIPWVSGKSLHKFYIHDAEEHVTQTGSENGTRIVPSGTILFLVRGMMLHKKLPVGLTMREVTFNQDVKAIIARKGISSKFLLYWFISSEKKILNCLEESSHGTGRLPTDLLHKIEISLPPRPEQEKIAEILGTWDEAIGLEERLIAALQKRKKGLMQRLLTGKVRFPSFDDEWEETKLDDMGEFSKGSGIKKSETIESGIPCIRYGEIYTKHDFVIHKFVSFISPETADKSKPIYQGDILFAGSGEKLEEIGKAVAYTKPEKAYAGGDIIILRLNKDDPAFLGYLLNGETVRRQIYKLGQGHSVVHVYSSSLKNIKILLPSLDEQKEIAKIFILADEEIQLHQQKLAGLQTQKKGLMQRLLTGQVRVSV